MTEILMPRLSDSMEEGTIITWLIEEGQEITRGQPIAEIETDKATMTYEADQDGVVIRLLLQEGDTAPLGAPIAEIRTSEEPAISPGSTREEPATSLGGTSEALATTLDPEPPQEAPGSKAAGPWTPSTPLARKQAQAEGVDISAISGSGPGGRVVAGDLPEAGNPTSSQPDSWEIQSRPTSRIERLIAKRMVEGKKAPEFWAEREVDLTRVYELREELKDRGERAPSINSLVMLAIARAASINPRINSSFEDEEIIFHQEVNLGMAVASEDSLTVPVISKADKMTLQEIDNEAKRLSEAVREGSITAQEMEGATITVSSLGSMGVDRFQAILPPGQSAIVALGALKEKIVMNQGQVAARQVISIIATVDHRSVYGAHLAEFLSDLAGSLENPLRLI